MMYERKDKLSSRTSAWTVAVLLEVSFGIAAWGRETYCNPLSIPDYPMGYFALMSDATHEAKARFGAFRELADPAVIRENGVWYVYADGQDKFCWKSYDDGATWQTVSVTPADVRLGYAPTVVKHRGQFLFATGWGTATPGLIYSSPTPEGPLTLLGKFTVPTADGAPREFADPMLFSDDGGKRLYFFWGCTPTSGLWGCELDPENPLKVISPAKRLVAYEPQKHPWQKCPDKDAGWIEASWMFRRGDDYYLVFGASGTEFATYATGVARAKSPLGDFVLQDNNPVFQTPKGVVTGTAHGAVVQDERGEWWYFYTVHAAIRHQFERRIGMDRVTFLPNGDMRRSSATSEPQFLPGHGKGCSPWKRIAGSYLCAGAAFDEDLKTEFAPNCGLPYELEYAFKEETRVRAQRVIWSDGNYDPRRNVNAGPIRYRLQLKMGDGKWVVALDATENNVDLIVDYREIDPVSAVAAKLEVVGAPAGILPRVVEWTLFGEGK